MGENYNAEERDWYRNAIQLPGQVTWTEPYQDVRSGETVITSASGVAGGTFSYLFGGNAYDAIPAFFAGFSASWILLFFQEYFQVRFFAEFMAAFLGGAVAIVLVIIEIGENVDQVIIGTLMTGVAHVAKGGAWISGDSYSTIDLGEKD